MTKLEAKSKVYQIVMVKNCIDDQDLRILKMLNFTKGKDVNDMQIVMVKLDI